MYIYIHFTNAPLVLTCHSFQYDASKYSLLLFYGIIAFNVDKIASCVCFKSVFFCQVVWSGTFTWLHNYILLMIKVDFVF